MILLDTFNRQAIQKKPLLSFSRTGDGPVQWIQLLHALDQPGWTLLTPLKVTIKKCKKCSQEFCSPVNYRRHIRVHRRSLNVNKESHKNIDLLAAFWDKLSVEEAKEVLSLKDASLKTYYRLRKIPSTSVIRALASSLRQPGVWTLPQVYVRAGSTLLDIIQANSSRLPISSHELFSILDDASENTFLCAGTAESLQKYVFDEETAKHSLELMNLIACTTFLFEQQLVKAWIDDKDAEALRCQKLLVEEEEAAQKRQAALLEREKQKKLFQKEQKTNDQLNECKEYLNISINTLDEFLSAEVPDPTSPSDSNLNSPDMLLNVASCPESLQLPSEEIDVSEAQFDFDSEYIDADNFHTVETTKLNSDGCWRLATNRLKVAKSQKGGRNGFYVSHDIQALKSQPTQNLTPEDHGTLLNGNKARTKKFKVDNDDENSKPRLQKETSNQTEQNSFKVMIGSIPVSLRDPDEVQDTCSTEHAIPKKSDILEKLVKRSAHKPWIPVNRHETIDIWPFDKGDEESEGSVLDEAGDQTVCSESCMQSCSIDSDNRDCGKHSDIFSDGNAKQGGLSICSIAAKEFFAHRWKDTMSSNHVKLVLSSELEPPLFSGTEDNWTVAAQTSVFHECTVNGNTETEKQHLGQESSGNAQVKFRN